MTSTSFTRAHKTLDASLTPGAGPQGRGRLEVESLSVAFTTRSGTARVVDDIDFSLRPGGSLGIVGESGSGKSMTALAIMGLLPESATMEGYIRFEGEEISALSESEHRRVRGRRIGMVFQDPLSALNPYYTVGAQIAEAFAAHHKASKKQAWAAAVDAMDSVGIKDAEHRSRYYPHQFSGGMRQRVMIAMVLCNEPDLIIADEPTTALDVTVQKAILDLLSEIRSRTGAGLILITHDLAVVSGTVDKILVMHNGLGVEHGTTEQIFSDPQDPYTQMLLDAIPRIDARSEDLPIDSPGSRVLSPIAQEAR